MLRSVVAALVAASALSSFAQLSPIAQLPTGAAPLASNPSATKFTFVVAGDNRQARRGDPLTQPLLDIASRLKASPPSFIVWNGDTIFGKSAVGTAAEYTQFLGVWNSVPVPIFNAPGNHELVVQTNIPCDGKFSAELPDYSGAMLTTYQQSMGAPYGMFRYGNAAFLLLNTDDVPDLPIPTACDYNGFVSQAQLGALTASLTQLAADTTVAHIFVFMHRPIHDKGKSKLEALTETTSDYAARLQAFRKLLDGTANSKVTFVFASHDHLLYVYDNGSLQRTAPTTTIPTFIVTGGAGAPLSGCKSGTPAGSYFHYTTVTVDGANVSVAVEPLYGTTPCKSSS
ncbi:MAG: putative phosphohydrolase [Acidobacteria bacterium]|nr:putative phosphohydrolase [Acidobacteriota bacterium]